MHRSVFWYAVALSLPAVAGCSPTGPPDGAKPADSPAAEARTPAMGKPGFTISAETTAVTEPVAPNGRIDYVAALNAKASAGIEPSQNAVVPLVAVLGSGFYDESDRRRFYGLLAVPLPQSEPESLLSQSQYAMTQGMRDEVAFFDEAAAAMEAPWTAEARPRVAGWLDACDTDIDAVAEAVLRPAYYYPMVSPPLDDQPKEDGPRGPELVAVLLPLPQATRDAGRALAARAMRRVGEDDVGGAIEDALALHRLARLVASGQTLIESLVGVSLESIAAHVDVAIVASGKLTLAQAQEFFAELGEMSPLPPFLDRIDVGERWMGLDVALAFAFEGPKTLELATGLGPGGTMSIPEGLERLPPASVDWDVLLTQMNDAYDELVSAWRQPRFVERRAALKRFDERLQTLKSEVNPVKLGAILKGDAKDPVDAADRLAKVFISLLTPAAVPASVAEARGATWLDLARLALALEGARLQNGMWPQQLSDLAPGQPERVPVDRFTGKPLRYERTDAGIRLYSLGPNGQDDGGVLEGDKDDIVITLDTP